jgi:hypothetical protein
MACNPNEIQDAGDLGGESDCGARQEFVEQDLDRVEPIERAWSRAMCNAFTVVALAEVPQADLVKIVKAQGTCKGTRKSDVAGRGRDDVGQVEFVEVGPANNRVVIDVADDGLQVS